MTILKEKIIQFGEGVFLRGFVDDFIQKMNEKHLFNGSVVVVQPRKGGRVQILNEQKGKYNLYLRGIENGAVKVEHSVVEAISRGIDPYENFDEYMALADQPEVKFIFSNTTEAGIVFDESCKFCDRPASSYPGKLTQLLYKRFQNGLGGFRLLPCELIDNNGGELKKCVLQYAALWQLGEGFIKWLETENSFCNTLVDRIVTGFPKEEAESLDPADRLLDTAELFHLWVIEGHFEEELPLQKAGIHVIWTDNAAPYKKRKVRLLNGSHTSMALGALLAGLETVGECMNDEVVFAFLQKCLFGEILPTIGAAKENKEFAENVLDRFRNPYIKHQLRSIALNSVSKFSVRVLPTMIEYKEQNGIFPPALTLSLALLIAFYKKDEPADSPEVIALMKEKSIDEILSNSELWKCDLSLLSAEVKADFELIEKYGAREAMRRFG